MSRRTEEPFSPYPHSRQAQLWEGLRIIHKGAFAVLIAFTCTAQGQVSPGTPSFTTFDSHGIDVVNLMNNNVMLNVPVRNEASGAMSVNVALSANLSMENYDGIWEPMTLIWPLTPNLNGVLLGTAFVHWGSTQAVYCPGTQQPTTQYSNWYLELPNGTVHLFPASLASLTAPCPSTSTAATIDGSGYTLTLSGGNVASLTDRGGTSLSLTGSATGSLTDPNGNSITASGSSAISIKNTMGITSVTYYPSPTSSYNWADPNGGSAGVGLVQANDTIQTAFGCSGITDFPAGGAYLPTAVSLADGTSIGITYEGTPGHPGNYTGRLAQLTLREGGTVSYTYGGSHNGIDCVYQNAQAMTRTLGNGDQKTYTLTHPQIGTTANYQAVNTVVDPGGNKTVYTFTGFTSSGLSGTYAQVLTMVQKYQGLSTLLTTDKYCYNGHTTNCDTAQVTLPASEVDLYHTINGMSNSSRQQTKYDTYGNVTYHAEYDFGASTPTRATTITYYQSGTSCGALSSGSAITNKPCEVQSLQNGSVVADAKYTFDSHGNLLTTSLWNGSSWIGQSTPNAYNSNGTPSDSYDLANNHTIYSYSPTGYANCTVCTQFPFPTSITKGGLTTSARYDGFGNVKLTDVDPNGNTITYCYNTGTNCSGGTADPYWRVLQTIDPYGSTVVNTYPSGSSPDTSNSSFTFNSSNSTNSTTITTDGYGRPINSQTAQSPSGSQYDTLSTTYSWSATYRAVATSEPCSTTSGSNCTTVHASTYDPLGRLSTASTTSNETLAHTYTQNDDLPVLTPVPTGENSKKVQTEYDGLGRVSKVCHIGSTTSTGSGTTCNQNTGTANGQTDSYSYTQGTGWTKVSITRGSQTRSKTFDAMGRVTQIVTPEGGTWNYYYDVQGGCPGSVPGKLTIVQDPNSGANGTCYYYDSLGRVVTESARSTVCRHFYYDNTTGYKGTIPTGITLSNQYGRLVEAATDACAANTLKTDEWFAYDKNGRTTDFWEQEYSTPTQYYHSKATFFENGAVKTLQIANPSAYTLTYTLDGEGRWNTLTDTTASQNIVTGVNFFPAHNPEVVNLTGTTPDNDAYTIDANSGRISQYAFTVGNTPKTLTGALTWNANGTLAKLATTDGFDSGGSLTCTDAYDDWARLTSFDCGSGNWGQSFSYDVYDNMSKSVLSGRTGTSWNPGYSSSTNQFTGGSFDSNGNTTADGTGSNYWGWNEFSKMAWYNTSSIAPTCGTAGKCMIYDAFGRVISYTNGSYWYDLFYTQNGGQVTMTSPNIYYAKFPAPGHHGVAVIYGNNSTYVNYLHGDWLGNARINSTVVTNTEGDDRAYTPYGEQFTTYGLTESWYQDFAGMTGDFNNGIQWETPNREFAIFGRWLSPDPAGQGWNQYAYVTNPNSSTDPLGLGREPHPPAFSPRFGSSADCYDETDLMATCQNYSVDGVDVPAWVGQGELSSGAVAPCPNNACSGTNYFGLPVQYVANAVTGFYTALVPGEWPTARDATIVAGVSTDPQSIATNRELIGNIYKTADGKYSWTAPLVGDPDAAAQISSSDIPDGTTWAGTYHTHGAYDPTAYNEQFSPIGCKGVGSLCDMGTAMLQYLQNGQTGIFGVATPAGRIEIFDPSLWPGPGSLCVAVGSSVQVGPGSSTISIGTCH